MTQPYRAWDGPMQLEILKRISVPVIKYINWYCEYGIHLPDDLKSNPGEYTQRLRIIQNALEMISGKKEVKTEEDSENFDKGIDYFFMYFKELFK